MHLNGRWVTRAAVGLLMAVLACGAARAAEITSQACARWEGNYRDLTLQAAALLALLVLASAWLAPWVMAATGRMWRWALGLAGRALWPALLLALLTGTAWLLFVLPGPLRGELAVLQIQPEYFPAPLPPEASRTRPTSSSAGSTSAVATTSTTTTAPTTTTSLPVRRPADCTTVNFAKHGLLFGLGAGETLSAQPFLILFFLLGACAVGALAARLSYWIVGRVRAPLARARRAAREGRGLLR